MEKSNKLQISRCFQKLKEIGAPITGWLCYDIYDVFEDNINADFFTCELCGNPTVRFVHVMENVNWFGRISVGCVCAGILENDINSAKSRETDIKNRAKRRETFMSNRFLWREKPNGNFVYRFKGRWITITPSHYDSSCYGVVFAGKSVWKYKGQKIRDIYTAQLAAFELFDENTR
jgi:hypothetical protein